PRCRRTRVVPAYAVAGGSPHGRKVGHPSPDTEETRPEGLRLIATATPAPTRDYPFGLALVEATVFQAGEFRDLRYVPGLDRIRQFAGPRPAPESDPAFGGVVRGPARLAELPARALALILPPDPRPPLR